HRDGLAHQGLQTLDQPAHIADLGFRQDRHEFIARQPARDARLSYLELDTIGDGAQQIVACRMTQRIVHVLEAVEVDEQHGGPLAFLGEFVQQLIGIRRPKPACWTRCAPPPPGASGAALARVTVAWPAAELTWLSTPG